MGSQDDRSDAGSCPEDIQDAACVDTEPVHADEEDPECAGAFLDTQVMSSVLTL
jgi:hypothetical protein